MLGELAAYYGVSRVTAVLKRDNRRSLRLLERLGFTLASPESQATDVEPDEIVMEREMRIA